MEGVSKHRVVNYTACLVVVALLHATKLAYVPLPVGYVDASIPFVLFAALFSPGIAVFPALLWCVLQLAFAPQVYYASVLIPLLVVATKFLRIGPYVIVSVVFTIYAVLLQVFQPMPLVIFVTKVVLEFLFTVSLTTAVARQARQVTRIGETTASLLWVFQESTRRTKRRAKI